MMYLLHQADWAIRNGTIIYRTESDSTADFGTALKIYKPSHTKMLTLYNFPKTADQLS